MPPPTIIPLCLLLAVPAAVHAQGRSPGAYISYADDLYKISDPHGSIRKVVLPNPEVGIYWRRNFESKFCVQAGVSAKPYWEGFQYDGASSYLTTLAFTAIKLNADVGYRLRLSENLWLVPRAGASVAVNTAYYIGSQMAMEVTHANGAVIHSTYEEREDVNRYFVLPHAAIGLEQTLFRSFVISIHLGYHDGFMKANVLNIRYTIDQSPTYYATAVSRGQYWDLGLGVGYKIGF